MTAKLPLGLEDPGARHTSSPQYAGLPVAIAQSLMKDTDDMNQRRVESIAERRVLGYWLVGIGLVIGYAMMRGSGWQGSAQLHTLMECIATLLALMVGAMALVRFYSKKNNTFLFIGTAFLGTGILDGYHALVTSHYITTYLPSDLPSLIPWSWVASRMFLALLMYLSYLAWTRENRLGEAGRINERAVYLIAGALTLASFLFFAFVPLPRAYYPELWFHRPEEFVPALLFLLALVGYLRKGIWRHDAFEHWLVLSLIVGLVSQAVFMSFSGQLFDFEFDAAHTFKKVSYICVLIGLMSNMYGIFRRAEADRGSLAQEIEERKRTEVALRESEERFRAVVNNSPAKIHIKDARGRYTLVNRHAEKLFGVTDEEARGKTTDEIFPPKVAAAFTGHDQVVLETGQAVEQEEIWLGDDRIHTYLTVKFPILNAAGRINGVGAIGTDITERKAAEEAMLAVMKEAEIANRAKSEFLANMSHELRTPLNAIIGFSEIIKDETFGPVGSAKYRGYADDINESGQHLLALINDILDLSKVESGAEKLHEENIDILATANAIMKLVKGLARAGNLQFELDVSDDIAVLHADKRKVKQILLNLLSNAIKFTPEGGKVTLKIWSRAASGYVFQIIDTGIGIAFEDIPKALAPFQQIDSGLNRKHAGTGLGLPLTKSLVEMHGGYLDMQSKVGIGTTVTVRFPAERIVRSPCRAKTVGAAGGTAG